MRCPTGPTRHPRHDLAGVIGVSRCRETPITPAKHKRQRRRRIAVRDANILATTSTDGDVDDLDELARYAQQMRLGLE